MITTEASRTSASCNASTFARQVEPARSTAENSGDITGQTPAHYWAILVAIGLIGGILSGLFAIGGAIVMVPLLVWRTGMDQRRAAATSLVAIIPSGVVSSAAYLIHGDANVTAALWISLGAIVGAAIGSRLLSWLPLPWLRWLFITFILIIAIQMFVVVPDRGHVMASSLWLTGGQMALGLLAGVASGLFGIGGAIVAVPLLVSVFGVSDLVAKGTALLVGVPTSVVGTLSNRRKIRVDVRAGLVLGTAAVVAALPAAYVEVIIPARLSGILFGVLLLVVAAQLAVRPTPGRPFRPPTRAKAAHPG
jgi:uncharacterized membrane protein YfcA